VEGGLHAPLAQGPEGPVAASSVRVAQVEDVVVGRSVRELGQQAHAPGFRPAGEAFPIPRHDRRPPGLDGVELVELGVEERGQHVGEDVAAALGDPRVLVHLAPEEGGPVRPFLPRDLGTVGDLGVGDHEGTSLAARHVLRLVEAQAPGVPEGAEGPPAPAGGEALGRVLDRPKAVAAGEVEEGFHVRGDPGVVDREDGRRPRRQASLHVRGIEAQGLLLDLGEDRTRAHPQHRVRARDEGERWADDLLAGPDPEGQEGQLQGVGARRREQDPVGAQEAGQPAFDAPPDRAVPRGLAGEGGPDRLDFSLVEPGGVEGDRGERGLHERAYASTCQCVRFHQGAGTLRARLRQ